MNMKTRRQVVALYIYASRQLESGRKEAVHVGAVGHKPEIVKGKEDQLGKTPSVLS